MSLHYPASLADTSSSPSYWQQQEQEIPGNLVDANRRGSCPSHGSSESSPVGRVPLTVPPVQPQQVRWFYCQPGCYWQPFCGYDSLVLEQQYSRLVSMSGVAVAPVSVLGDMYEVELKMAGSTMVPIYWTIPKPWSVMRAFWFEVSNDRWYPVKEKEAHEIEAAHCRRDWREKTRDMYRQQCAVDPAYQSLTTNTVNTPISQQQQQQQQQQVILHKIELAGYTALWLGHSDVIKVKKDITSQLLRVGGKIIKRDTFGSTKLQRGYRDAASKEDKPPPIGHIVFAVHGIGQNMESANVVKSVNDLRETCTQVALKQFAGSWNDKRVEFIPIEWRTKLNLDRATLDGITPHGVKAVRNIVNDSVIDVFYYMSPCFGPEILDGFRWQIHKLYNEFMVRHPQFLANGGTVSLFGHSLGSVICYDIMYNTSTSMTTTSTPPTAPAHRSATATQQQESTDSPMAYTEWDEKFAELQELRIRMSALESELETAVSNKTLDFQVDHFFAVGSPLGLFIMMRDQANHLVKDQRSAATFLPSTVCRRIYNVHHPSDPVAYRLEPLASPAYSQIRPVRIESAGSKPSKSAKKMAEGPQPVDPKPEPQGWWSSFVSSGVKAIATASASAMERVSSSDKLMNDDSKVQPDDRLKERLDFMLKEGIVENSYLNTITAHTCYWTSQDVALFLLLQLYTYKRPMSGL